MRIIQTGIEGLLLIEPKTFKDERGEFFESYSLKNIQEHTGPIDFVQDNHSISKKGVLRGLHYQKPPFAQAKLVRVTQGSAIDTVVDIRSNSETYGRYYNVELSAENKLAMYVPVGFAHGFEALEDQTHFQYKCTEYYHPESEDGILFSSIPNLTAHSESPILNQKDQNLHEFNSFKTPF